MKKGVEFFDDEDFFLLFLFWTYGGVVHNLVLAKS